MGQDLVERARRGDHDAFAVLAGAAISRLDAAAWLMLRDPDLAMDAVQNTLVRAWRDLPALRDPDRFDAWLYRLHARLLRRDPAGPSSPLRGRHRRPRDRALDRRLDVDDRGPRRARARLRPPRPGGAGGHRAASLPRPAAAGRHFLDLPLPDVAATLGIPLGTVKSRLYRGLREMRAVLDADARPGSEIHEGHPA
jgi:RNA polymerase sigma-70 factor (ECF subfamily)